MKKFFLILLLALYSCNDSNELDINEEYKDIPVVYAILNSGTSEDSDGAFVPTIPETDFDLDNDVAADYNYNNFVRVQKAFLGAQSAYDYANINDSIYYDPTNIQVDVQLVHSETGQVGDSVLLDLVFGDELASVYDIVKEDGLFNSDDYYLYKIPTSVEDLCQGNCNDIYKNYKINVRTLANGALKTHAYSETNIVEPIEMQRPTPNGLNSIVTLSTFPYYIDVKPSRNAKMYEVTLRFNYIEQTKQGYLDDQLANITTPTNGITYKYVDFSLTNQIASDVQYSGSGSTLTFMISPSAFFEFLETQISDQDLSDPEFYRYPVNSFWQGAHSGVSSGIYHRCLDVIVTAVNDELYTYLNVNQGSFGFNQDSPGYNNVTNGIGHVSSRSILNLNNLRIPNVTLDSISFGQSTKNLNFACYDLFGTTSMITQFGFDCQEN